MVAAVLVLLPESLARLRACAPFAAYLGPLLAFNLALSCEPHIGVRIAARWLLVGVLTAAMAGLARAGARDALARAGAFAGSVAAGFALWQGLAGSSRMAARLADASFAMKEAALARLSSGRVYGPFLLPASLAGAMAVTLPLTLALAAGSRTGRGRVLGTGLALLQLAALLWTVSLGGWTALALSAAIVLSAGLLRTRRGRRTLAIGVVLGAGIVAGGVIARLTLMPPPGPPDRPLGYRAGNWEVAAKVFADHPFLGTGLGTFGDVFPAYRREGMNETRYAHCTWLQIPAEMGIGAVPPLLLVLLGAFVLVRRAQGGGALEKASAIGALSFLLHNAVDFTAYQPSVLALFGLALALSTSGRARALPVAQEARSVQPFTGGEPEGEPAIDEDSMLDRRGAVTARAEAGAAPGRSRWMVSRWAWIGAILASAAAAVVIGASGLSDLATERAAGAHGRDIEEERRALELASRLDPLDAGPPGNLALVLAGQATPSIQDLERAEKWARAAIALDTRTAFRRRDLAWILVKQDRAAEAWIELSKAAALYPMKREYREDLERLQTHLFRKNGRTGFRLEDGNEGKGVFEPVSAGKGAAQPRRAAGR